MPACRRCRAASLCVARSDIPAHFPCDVSVKRKRDRSSIGDIVLFLRLLAVDQTANSWRRLNVIRRDSSVSRKARFGTTRFAALGSFPSVGVKGVIPHRRADWMNGNRTSFNLVARQLRRGTVGSSVDPLCLLPKKCHGVRGDRPPLSRCWKVVHGLSHTVRTGRRFSDTGPVFPPPQNAPNAEFYTDMNHLLQPCVASPTMPGERPLWVGEARWTTRPSPVGSRRSIRT